MTTLPHKFQWLNWARASATVRACVSAAPRDTGRSRCGRCSILTRAVGFLIKATLILVFAMTGVSALCHAESPAHSSLIVEDIRCKGNALTRCSFIRGFLHLSPGDALSEEEIQSAKLRLSSLPDFVSVQIYLDKGSAKGRAIVVIEVVEADRIDNQISAGTSSRLSSRYQTVEGRVAERDLFGTQGTVNLDVEGVAPIDGPAHHGVYTRLQFAAPTLLDSNKYFLISGLTYQNTVIAYPYYAFDKTDQFDIDLSVGRRLFDYSYVTVGYLERLLSQSISQSRGAASGLFSTNSNPNNNKGWALGYGWNSEDDPYFPTQGSRLSSSFGESWASVRFRKTWSIDPGSTWSVQLGGTPGTQYRASLDENQDFSLGYQHRIGPSDHLGGINRGRWYVEPGLSYYGDIAYGKQLWEWGLKAGVRLDTKLFGLVDLYVIASTSEQRK
jgi:outer membrane protein assembly factor BamA